MKIQFLAAQKQVYNLKPYQPQSAVKYQFNLQKDTVSFGAIKKSKLDNYQLLCANYFKAPIEKFNTEEDYKKWANSKLDKTLEFTQYTSYSDVDPNRVDEETTNCRFDRLKQWENYLLNDPKMKRHPELALFVADQVTKNLYPDTKTLPPVFDKKIIELTISDLGKTLSANPKAIVNLNKKYQENLRAITLQNVEKFPDQASKNNNYWVKIPSKIKDLDNFSKNVKNLNILSSEAWCTKGHFAEKYLSNNDFYLYINNNSPELSIRVEHSNIKEVRDKNHSQKIGLNYLNSLNSIIESKNLTGYDMELQDLGYRQQIVDLHKSFMEDDINNKNYKNILKSSGIDVNVREDGLMELSHFEKPNKDYTYEDLGINENDMFKNIAVIKGNADFSGTRVTNLGKLESIDGYVFLGLSNINSLGNVKTKQRVFWN